MRQIICITILSFVLLHSQLFAQGDSLLVKDKKQSFFITAGLSLPMAAYASTSEGNAAYAKTGFATTSIYSRNIYKMVEVVFSHVFIINKVNNDALVNNIKTTIGNQVDNDITYASAKSSHWNSNSLLAGIGIRKAIDAQKKLNFYANAQAGISLVNSPYTETIVQIDQLFYSTKVRKSTNWAPVFGGNLGVNYLFFPKTSLVFNANFISINLVGNNLDVTEIGNNTYLNKIYSFEQQISSLNFTLGFCTHF
jgi:hypothetical protein